MNKKIIGSVVITGMLAAGLSSCGTNQQGQNRNNMQRVQYQTQNQTGQNRYNVSHRPYVDKTSPGDYTLSDDERFGPTGNNRINNNGNMRVGYGNNNWTGQNNNFNTDWNNNGTNRIGTGQNNNTNTGAGPNIGSKSGLNDGNYNGFGDIRNDFGLRNNLNNNNNNNNRQNTPQITLSGNSLTVPKENVVTRNNINYVDITGYCNLASTEEQMNARKINYGRVSTNNGSEKYDPVPMGSINLPGCTSFVEFDAKNPNLMYVKDAPSDNTLVSKPITISNNEAIKMENGRVLCPASTLQKIVAQKTVTNPKNLKVFLGK